MESLYPLISAIFGYKITDIFTNPKSKIWQHYPHVKIKRLELLPSLRITIKGRIIHFHHWFNFSILFGVSFFSSNVFFDSWVTRGVFLGIIAQGLATPSARKIIYKK
jgi:hypothetical protein